MRIRIQSLCEGPLHFLNRDETELSVTQARSSIYVFSRGFWFSRKFQDEILFRSG